MRRVLLAIAGAACAFSLSGSAAGSAAVPHWKAWLCLPNHSPDWCYIQLPTVVVSASGSEKPEKVVVPAHPPIDCFYVYPTVSTEKRGNADLVLRSAEKEAAIIQAARFSEDCRVFAPLYRQTTGTPGYVGNPKLAYADVLAAWKDYLANYNDGRGVVLIGHSQGSFVLKQLIQEQIETSPAERRLLVSAILLGGDVVAADGSTTGGDFKRIPACTSATETGCVVAYSSWSRTPPANADLQGVFDGENQHVLCVNPAAPGSTRSEPITPIFAGLNSEGIVPPGSPYLRFQWVEFTGRYIGRCVRQGTRSWLLVSPTHVAGDPRPVVRAVLGPDSGLHAADVNIALANLVSLVASQSRAWLARH